MSVFEAIEMNCELLRRLESNGVKTCHWRLADLFSDYLAAAAAGEKMTYVVSLLAERYGMAERSVYRALRLLQREFII